MPTARFTITDSAWTDLGTTPCALQLRDGLAFHMVIDSTAPTTADLDATIVIGGREGQGGRERESTVNLGLVGGQHVYARTPPGASAIVVVAR